MTRLLIPAVLLLPLTFLTAKATWHGDYCAASELANSTTDEPLECPVKDLGGIAYCSPDNRSVYIQACYCMTFPNDTGDAIVGNCVLTCPQYPHYCVPWNGDKVSFNRELCSGAAVGSNFSRYGIFCGRCKRHHSVPVYSLQYIRCAECDGFSYKNLFKYIAIAYGPLTLFFFFIVIFRLSATSGSLNAYIFFCQIITLPIMLRTQATFAPHNLESANAFTLLVISLCSIWNLDFLRGYYKPFCLVRHRSPAGVVSLDYLIAVYPLLLVLLTYWLVVLYDRNYRIITALWKPFHKFSNRLREQWNVRSSLIDAFATFFLLSYVKILSVTFDLLMFTTVYNQDGRKLKRYILYNNPSITVHKQSDFYYILAVVVFVVFILSPMALLCLYPCRCFQKCLNRCGSRCLPLHAFMDVLTGCYRHTPRDCRYFAGVYLLMRLLVMVIFQLTLTVYFIPALAIFLVAAAIVFAIARPYKNPAYNVIDVVILLLSALFYITLGSRFIAEYTATRYRHVALKITQISAVLIFFYPIVLTLLWLMKLMKAALHKASERTKEDGKEGERRPLIPQA